SACWQTSNAGTQRLANRATYLGIPALAAYFARRRDKRPRAGRRSALLPDVTRLAVDSTGDGFAVMAWRVCYVADHRRQHSSADQFDGRRPAHRRSQFDRAPRAEPVGTRRHELRGNVHGTARAFAGA